MKNYPRSSRRKEALIIFGVPRSVFRFFDQSLLTSAATRLGIAIFAFLPLTAFAHPGHGAGYVPPAHFITSPDHLGMFLVIGVVMFCFVRALRLRPPRSADLQSAVSPICNRQSVRSSRTLERSKRPQVENLRYGRLKICATS